jgi:hypothetical protein
MPYYVHVCKCICSIHLNQQWLYTCIRGVLYELCYEWMLRAKGPNLWPKLSFLGPHTLFELWSPRLSKWLILRPQFCFVAKILKNPLCRSTSMIYILSLSFLPCLDWWFFFMSWNMIIFVNFRSNWISFLAISNPVGFCFCNRPSSLNPNKYPSVVASSSTHHPTYSNQHSYDYMPKRTDAFYLFFTNVQVVKVSYIACYSHGIHTTLTSRWLRNLGCRRETFQQWTVVGNVAWVTLVMFRFSIDQ